MEKNLLNKKWWRIAELHELCTEWELFGLPETIDGWNRWVSRNKPKTTLRRLSKKSDGN